MMDCFAKYADGFYYPAKRISENEMTVTVIFTQDNVQSKILPKHVHDLDTLSLGPSTQCLGLKDNVYKKFEIQTVTKAEVPERPLYFGNSNIHSR